MKAASAPQTPIRYDVDLSQAKKHQLKIEMSLHLDGNAPVDVALPAVTPGAPSHGLLNHASRISRLRVTDGHGRAVPFEKLPDGGWRLHRGSAGGDLKVSYTLNAKEFDEYRNELNGHHAHLNGSAAFMLVIGHQTDIPSAIKFHNLPDSSWKSISTLPRVLNAKHTFYSQYYDDIADSHFELGNFKEAKRFVNGMELVIAQHGDTPFANMKVNGVTPAQNLDDLEKISRAFAKDLGEFPAHRYKNAPPLPAGVDQARRYVVFKHYTSRKSPMLCGLEHYHGHELVVGKSFGKKLKTVYGGDERKLEVHVMAHEFGHRLNGKFLQHDGIDSADLAHVTRSEGLWLTEGGNSWLDYRLELDGGLIKPHDYLKVYERQIGDYRKQYAAVPSSPREDSLEAQNGNKNYYVKGELTALALDLEIRHSTGGEKSWMDVLRGMKDEFGGTGKFWQLDDLERVAARSTGCDLKPFFDAHLRGHEALPLRRALGYAGYALKPKHGSKGKMEIVSLPHLTESMKRVRASWLGA